VVRFQTRIKLYNILKIKTMAKTPFKMKGSPMQRNLGISPVKQKPEGFNWTGDAEAKRRWSFDKFQSQKQKGKEFVKNLKKKGDLKPKSGGKLGGRLLGTLGFVLGSTETATATQPGTGGHGGTKVSKLTDMISKKEKTTRKFPTRKFPTRKF